MGSAGAGNLTISSPLDQDHYIARESNSGFNASVNNRLAIPTQAQVIAAANRHLSGRERTELLTKAAGLGAAGLAFGPTVPAALTACLANITLCAI